MKKLFTKLAVIALSAMMVLTITPGTLMAEEMPEEYQEPAEQEIPVEIPVEAPAVVSLNGTDYASFAQALSNLQSGDYTLVLKEDVVLANPVTVSVPWGTTLTLDLAGYTIKLLDPSEDSAGQDRSGSDSTGDGGLFVVKSGTFNITDSDYNENGKISSSNNAQPAFKVIWDVTNGTYLNLKGGNFVSSSYQNLIALKDDYGSDASLQDGEVVISGGYYNVMQPEQYVVSGKSMTDAGGYYELTDAPVVNTYTVTWFDAYNNVLQTATVNEGETISYSGEAPAKAADDYYTYDFAGWSVDTVNYGITGNTDVYPTYNQTPVVHTYTVTWYDAYNNVLQTATVNEGETISYNGEAPAKAADESYTYDFAGWSVDTVNYGITGNTDVFPTYNQTPIVRTYTVTWYDAYGSVLQTATVNEGEPAYFSGENPTKEADADYTYTFDHWDQDTTSVAGDMYVNPVFNATEIVYTYTVTWYDAYGNVFQTATVNKGEAASCSDTPTKEADADNTYTFSGWDQDTGAVTSDMYVNPVFTAIPFTYTVTWYDAYGNVFQTATVNKGEAASCSDTPTKEADAENTYTFSGWDQDTSAVTSDMYVNPIFTATPVVHNYYVTFDVQAEGVPAPDGQTVEQGNTAYEPEAPVRDGYRFVGWFTEGAETKFDFSTQIYSDLTLYARWQQQFDVSYVSAHGYLPESMRLYAGDMVPRPEPDPTEDGWSFGGWFIDEACTQEYTFDSGIDNNLVLYAKWDEVQPTEYEVSFEVKEDPAKAPEPELIEEGKTAVDPGPVEVEGYKFEGWFEEGSAQAYDFEEPVRGNVSLMAALEAAPAEVYEVSFDMQGHGTAIETQTVEAGETATRPEDPSEDGWIFNGWFEADATEPYNFETPVTSSFTLYAKWTEKSGPFEVDFNMQGHGTAIETQTVEAGETATRPEDPSEDGWIFNGWFEADATEPYNFETPVTSSFTLYAKWTEKSGPFEVDFNMQGHGTAIETQTVEAGETATRPEDPSADGWTFGGWYQEAECTTEYDFAASVNSSMTLYAKWTQNPAPVTYTVKFDVQNHGTAPQEQKVEAGKSAIRPEKDPEAEGWTFGGW
ncbi:MAG: InlB B-repeat-containing protein, partial [Parasporobacterium sp.]|nr:InlB B-repeat-containing protein [Parasporobacterium sp.]